MSLGESRYFLGMGEALLAFFLPLAQGAISSCDGAAHSIVKLTRMGFKVNRKACFRSVQAFVGLFVF